MRELESLEAWTAWLAQEDSLAVAVQQVDCSNFSKEICSRPWEDSLFLGCTLDPASAAHVVQSGGMVVPQLEAFEFQVHRASLYSVDSLYRGFELSQPDSYEQTPDARIYRQYLEQGKEHPSTIRVSLARRLHDHSITDALMEQLEGKAVAAVMGGHGMERRDPVYAQIAHLSRTLAREGFCMITGGGPGAMEACHLGVYLAGRSDEALETALNLLAPRPEGAVPGQEYADADWLGRAWRVREAFPAEKGDPVSIGIPTWMYGHEPPAVFAHLHAKYFANSVREDGLLMWANHGVVFAPGSAGTLQEIFQDACQNHYEVLGYSSPMILLGCEHWTDRVPAWPLLQTVSVERGYRDWLRLTDDPAEVVRILNRYRDSRTHA